jgi:cytidylate kinase
MKNLVIVAIDGPSGVGKSTAARRLAQRLDLPFMDTGAMYRAVALRVLEAGASPHEENAVVGIAGETDVRLGRRDDGSFEVLLDGEPVEGRIRTPEVGEATSVISAYPEVRRRMVRLQREAAGQFGAVLEGRDIGTRVFPDTPYKFFLDSRPEVRFQRRFQELTAAGRSVTYEQVVEEITRRDQRDSTRADSPLTCDDTYTLIDSSDLTIDQVVEEMARKIGAGAGQVRVS